VAGQTPGVTDEGADRHWDVPRTPWGDPDLQGLWPGTDMVSVPLQRPPQFGERALLTDAELAERAEQQEISRRTFEAEGAGGATGAPGHWLEWGTPQRQASLIVDPPDGRIPPLTPEGRQRAAVAPRGTFGPGPLSGPEDMTLWERCITRGVVGSTLPVLYNNETQILQAPGYVAIRYEMVHETRVIPLDGRPHLGDGIRQYIGDARGHWDGDTLVIETTNFTDKTGVSLNGGGGSHSEALRLVERFTRVAPDVIQYEARIEDPRTWTSSWTIAFPLKRASSYAVYEYACHEGNYGLRHALSGSRATEAEAVREGAR